MWKFLSMVGGNVVTSRIILVLCLLGRGKILFSPADANLRLTACRSLLRDLLDLRKGKLVVFPLNTLAQGVILSFTLGHQL